MVSCCTSTAWPFTLYPEQKKLSACDMTGPAPPTVPFFFSDMRVQAAISVYRDDLNNAEEEHSYPSVTVEVLAEDEAHYVVQCDGQALGEEELPSTAEGTHGFIDGMNTINLYQHNGALVVAEPGDDEWTAFGWPLGEGRYRLQKNTQIWAADGDGTVGFLQFAPLDS